MGISLVVVVTHVIFLVLYRTCRNDYSESKNRNWIRFAQARFSIKQQTFHIHSLRIIYNGGNILTRNIACYDSKQWPSQQKERGVGVDMCIQLPHLLSMNVMIRALFLFEAYSNGC